MGAGSPLEDIWSWWHWLGFGDWSWRSTGQICNRFFRLSSFFLLSDFPDSFLLTGGWREHVLLHRETSQLSSWLHHHPANLWLSSGVLNMDSVLKNSSQVPANNFIINNSWDVDGNSKNVADTVGLMVYEGAGVIFDGMPGWCLLNPLSSLWSMWPIMPRLHHNGKVSPSR